jgi:prevent-host-death family protein
MMDSDDINTVSAFDAKNRLGSLLDRVFSGEELIITRHGQPVAKLVPIEKKKENNANHVLEIFRSIRASIATKSEILPLSKVIEWKAEGRK